MQAGISFPPHLHVRTGLLQLSQGMLCCRASAAANPARSLEKGTGVIFLLKEASLLATQQIFLLVGQIKKSVKTMMLY